MKVLGTFSSFYRSVQQAGFPVFQYAHIGLIALRGGNLSFQLSPAQLIQSCMGLVLLTCINERLHTLYGSFELRGKDPVEVQMVVGGVEFLGLLQSSLVEIAVNPAALNDAALVEFRFTMPY